MGKRKHTLEDEWERPPLTLFWKTIKDQVKSLGESSDKEADISKVVVKKNGRLHANIAILGTSGAGKTFTMQLMALRLRRKMCRSLLLHQTKGMNLQEPVIISVGLLYRFLQLPKLYQRYGNTSDR